MTSEQTSFHKIILADGVSSPLQIIWLHGWGQTHVSMRPLAERFARKAVNTLFDLPGFGGSPMLDEGAGSEDYAAALAAEISRLPAGPRIVVGHSFGCRVAIHLAASNPGLVAGLVLIAPAGLPRDRNLVWKIRASALKGLGKLAKSIDRIFGSGFHERYSARFGSADYRNAGALKATFVRVVNENLSGVAKLVSLPVLLVVGAEDTETPPEIARRYQQLIEGAGLAELPGFAHIDILGRGRHQVEARMNSFFKEHGFGA